MVDVPVKVSALLGRRWAEVELARLILDAGVVDWRAINLLAIGLAESNGFELAVRQNPGDPPSVDLGVWQINSRWHPEVSSQVNIDPRRQVVEAVRIARATTWQNDWNQWASWSTGRAKRYESVGPARNAVNLARAERGLSAI